MHKVRILYEAGFEGIGVSPRLIKKFKAQYSRECKIEWENDQHIEGRIVPVPAKYHLQEVVIVDNTWRDLYCENKEYGFLSFPNLPFINKISLQEINTEVDEKDDDPEIPLITYELDDKVIVFKNQLIYLDELVFKVTNISPNIEAGILTYDTEIKRNYLPKNTGTSGGKTQESSTLEVVVNPLVDPQSISSSFKSRKSVSHSSLNQLKGIDAVIERLRIEVIYPFNDILDQQLYSDPTPIGGVLLYGPPGTGKTQIAQAIADDLDLPLVRMDLGSIGSPYVHETSLKIGEKFEEAASYSQGAILFIDEIDAIAGHRSGMSTHDKENVNTLLQELDPKKRKAHVLVIAATNYMSELDTAVLRSGRFDTKIAVPPPNANGRFEILGSLVKKLTVDKKITHQYLKDLSKRMIGFVGADINTYTEKVVAQQRHRMRQKTTSTPSIIISEDFEEAFKSVTPLCELELNISRPTLSIENLYGAGKIFNQLKQELQFSIEPELYRQDLPAIQANGILLHGKPGTGKTSLANAIANELNVLFMEVNLGELKSKYVGDTNKNIASLFEKARLFRPILLFFDEIDSLGNRQASAEAHQNDAINAMLTQLSGANDNDGVLCMAATNLFEDIDPALKRTGRFGLHVEVTYPDEEGYRTQFSGLLSSIKNTVGEETIDRVVAHFANPDRPYSQAEVTGFFQQLLRYLHVHTKDGNPLTDEIINNLLETSHEY